MEAAGFEITLGQMLKNTLSFYDKIDGEISIGHSPGWLPLGHYMIMIVEGTHLLKRCFEERNYRNLSANKELEQFLNKNKDSLDLHSYKLLRKKISFIR